MKKNKELLLADASELATLVLDLKIPYDWSMISNFQKVIYQIPFFLYHLINKTKFSNKDSILSNPKRYSKIWIDDGILGCKIMSMAKIPKYAYPDATEFKDGIKEILNKLEKLKNNLIKAKMINA